MKGSNITNCYSLSNWVTSKLKLEQNSFYVSRSHQQLCVIQTEHSRKKEGGGFCKETFVTLTILLYTSPEDKTLNIHWACDTKGWNCQGTDMKAKPNWFQILWRVGCLTRWKFFANKHFNNSLYFPAFSFWLLDPTGEGRRGMGGGVC